MLYFEDVIPQFLLAPIIPGVEILSKKSACVVFFNVQNSIFRAAPESGVNGLGLMRSVLS